MARERLRRRVGVGGERDGRRHEERLGDTHRGSEREQHEGRRREAGGNGHNAPDREAENDEEALGILVADLPGDRAAESVDPEEDGAGKAELGIGEAEVRT